MSDAPKAERPAGWELIWKGNFIPPKYRSDAAPAEIVPEWADALPQGGVVLDIGCGLGRHCLYLGQRGFRVAGVDLSPTSITTTQALCADHQIPFEGYVTPMQSLPWPDSTFDGALAIAVIHHDRRAQVVRTLDEVRRVLRPGGVLLADFPSTAMDTYYEMRAQVAAGTLSEPEPNTFVDERATFDEKDDAFLPHHFSDEADLRDMLRAFDIVRLEQEQRGDKPGKWIVWARRPV